MEDDLSKTSSNYIPPSLAEEYRIVKWKDLESRVAENAGTKIRKALSFTTRGVPKLDDELIVALCKCIREGCTLANAARVCALPWSRLEKWLEKGKKDVDQEEESLEATLVLCLNSALGDQEAALSKIVIDQCKGDPRLALEVLSRRNPGHWAPATAAQDDTKNLYKDTPKAELLAEIKRLSDAEEKK